MIKYKSYGKMPKQDELYGVKGSFFNKPTGGLWGCRGDEWKQWCKAEGFNVKRLKHHFYFKLKQHSGIYRIRTKKDFQYLLDKYSTFNIFEFGEINYVKMAKDYDAVEVVGDIVYKLRLGCGKDHKGLYAWDVPSICVLNPDKVVLYVN